MLENLDSTLHSVPLRMTKVYLLRLYKHPLRDFQIKKYPHHKFTNFINRKVWGTPPLQFEIISFLVFFKEYLISEYFAL